MRNVIFVFFVYLLNSLAWGYPIYFKCEKGGSLSQFVTPVELAVQLQKTIDAAKNLDPFKQKILLQESCHGKQTCIEQLEQILKMSQSASKVTDAWVQEQMSKIKNEASKANEKLQGLLRLPDAQADVLLAYREMIKHTAESQQCRISELKLKPSDFRIKEYYCLLANFHHSPYMYVSGVRESGTNLSGGDRSSAPDCDEIDMIIQGAISANQDPYAAIALALMETGTQLGNLYLDPIGMIRTIGCKATSSTKAKSNLDTYGAYYNVDYKTVENSELNNDIKNYLLLQKMKLVEGTSYFCNESRGGGVFYEKPSSHRCCLKLPFKIENPDELMDVVTDEEANELRHPVARALMFKSLEKYLQAPLSSQFKSNDLTEIPARRLQRFNGYSTLMGGTESVSVWRSGVNHFKTPVYGYQALDFMLNTLMNNPYIQAKVSETEKDLKVKASSLICQDLSPGVYSIEHDYYFKKHANAPRMQTILDSWKKNKISPKLTVKQFRVIREEFNTVLESKKFPEFDQLMGQNSVPLKYGDIPGVVLTYYFEKIYPKRATVALANKMDQGFDWNEMKDAKFDAFLNTFSKNMK